MVRRVIQVVYREIRGLHQAAYVLALFTLGSQLLALVRDRLLAAEFGAGATLDLYYAAFRIPDLLYVLFASTLSVYVLIPFVAARTDSDDASAGRTLLSNIFTLFLIVYIVLGAAIAIAAPYLVPIFFPGFSESADMLVMLIRILLIQPLLLGISSLLGVITQLGHRFVLYALSPVLYNLGIILGLIFLYPVFGLAGLAFGVVLGALGHVLIQVPFVLTSRLRPRITTSLSWQTVREVLTVSVPRALTLSLHQFVLLALVGLASVMAAGSVSVFQFAFNLQSVPLAIIGVSYSVAAFPMLAKLYAEGNMERFARYITTALKHIIFWSLPVVALLIVIRAQFVRVILGSGSFDWDDTRLTAAVLALFAVSLVAQAIHLLIIRGLYAVGNTRLPFYTTLASSVGAICFALLLYVTYLTVPAFAEALQALLRLEGVPGSEVVVLALGYSIALLIHSIVLLALSQKPLQIRMRWIGTDFVRSFLVALFAGVSAYTALNVIVTGVRTETLIGIFLQGAFAGSVGIVAAIVGYAALGSPELKEVYRSFHRRIFKTDIVAPQDEDHLAV